MKKVFLLLCVTVFAALVWILWAFQPLMSAGRAVRISSEHLGEYDFQIWQRKNTGVTEPFSTGLFARREGGQWKAFLLDWQDTYRPAIVLRRKDASVEVLHGSNRLGVFDETQQTFRRDSNGASYPGDLLDSEPPGNWLLTHAGVSSRSN